MTSARKAGEELGDLVDSQQDTQLGKVGRSAQPGQSVPVTLGGNKTIQAIAGTPIKSGDRVAVGQDSSGQAIAISSQEEETRSQTLIDDTWKRPKKGQSGKVPEIEPAVCPILISETILKTLPAPPACTCPTWKIKRFQNGRQLAYQSCDGSHPSYPTKEEADEAIGRGRLWGIHEEFDEPGGTGFPWVSGVQCAYPRAGDYGYRESWLLNQGSDGHFEHSLYRISESVEGDILYPGRLYDEFGIVLLPPKWSEPGRANILNPSGNSTSVEWLTYVNAYRLSEDDFLKGYVAELETEPPTSGSLWRSRITYAFESDFDPGGQLESWASFKDELPFETKETTGGATFRLVYLCELHQIFTQSSWALVWDTDTCPLPPEADDLGDPPSEEGEDGIPRFLMTRYSIVGMGEPFPLPWEVRVDDPNAGDISYNPYTAEVYVVLYSGAEDINKQAEKEYPWKNANEFFSAKLIQSAALVFQWGLYCGEADNTFKYIDDYIYSESNLYSRRVAQAINHAVKACETTLFVLQISKTPEDKYSLSIKSKQTFKHNQSATIHPNNWKQRYMSYFLTAGKNFLILSYDRTNNRGDEGRLHLEQNLTEHNFRNDYLEFEQPNLSVDFSFALNDTQSAIGGGYETDNELIRDMHLFRKLSLFQEDKIDYAAKGLNWLTGHLYVDELYGTGNLSPVNLSFTNSMFMPLFGYINSETDTKKLINFYKRPIPLWQVSFGSIFEDREFLPYGWYTEKGVYFDERVSLMANLVEDKIYIFDCDQVDHINKEDTEDQIKVKLLEYEHGWKYKWVKSKSGESIKAKVKILGFKEDGTPETTIISKIAKEKTISIDSAGFNEQTYGLTIWCGAPGPAPKLK